MNLCKCGCGEIVEQNYKKGHGRRGKKNSEKHTLAISLSNKGRKHSKETKEKISKALTGRKISTQTRQKMSKTAKEKGFGKWMKGKHLSEETKLKLSEINKGHITTEETKEKISKANSGKNNGMWGKTHTSEAKAKIASRSKKLWKENENYRQYFSSEEAREKNRLSHLGKKASLETREKMSKSASKRISSINQQFFNNTKIEIKIQKFLDELNINYKKQYLINDIEHSYGCDIYIPETKMIIECDGDYWHKYPYGTEKDHIRNKEIENAGYKILRLWEHEINDMKSKEELLDKINKNFDINSYYENKKGDKNVEKK